MTDSPENIDDGQTNYAFQGGLGFGRDCIQYCYDELGDRANKESRHKEHSTAAKASNDAGVDDNCNDCERKG